MSHPPKFLVVIAVALAAARVAAQPGGTALRPPDVRPPDALPVADLVHEDIDALACRGAIDLPARFARPLLRYEVAQALTRGRKAHPHLDEDPVLGYLARGFAPEIAVLAGGPLAAPSAALVDLRDEDSWLRAEAFWNARAEAAIDRGFVLTDSTRFGLRFSWIVWPGFHLFEELYVADIEDGHLFADPLKPGTDIVIFQDRVYGAIHTRYADIVLGRDRLAWGPGATGSLLLSATARPFTHLRLSHTFFDGLLHAVVVNGILNQAERRYIAYHRLDWRLHERLRIGFAEGARYNADGLEPLYLIGIVPYPLVTRLLFRDNEVPETSAIERDNVIWALDSTWRPAPGFELYGELLIDDLGIEEEDHPTRLGYQMGAFVVGKLAGHECRIRLEGTRVWNFVYSTFYHADYAHEGVPLGYPLGPDCRVGHVRVDWPADRNLSLCGAAERQDRGEGRLGAAWFPDDPAFAGAQASRFEGIVETQWRFTAGCRYTPHPNLAAEVALGPAWVRNANHRDGERRRGMIGRLAISFRH